MKKRLFALFLSLTLILTLAACSGAPSPDGQESPEEPSGLPEAEAVMTGKIVKLDDGSFLLAGDAANELYSVFSTLDIYGPDGDKTDASSLKAGQTVDVGYSGGVMESYPMQLGSPVYVQITEEGEDMVGFYRQVLSDLWEVDSGLNGGIDILAFDLTEVSNLTEGEKSAFIWLAGGDYGVAGIAATFEELDEQGYIGEDFPYFETGLLITIEVSDVQEDSFGFDAQKWRSALGAYWFSDCKAEKGPDGWTYTIGSEAIS